MPDTIALPLLPLKNSVLFPFANVGRISPIITHCADYVELFMRTYIAEDVGMIWGGSF